MKPRLIYGGGGLWGAVNEKFPGFWMVRGGTLFHSFLGLWTSITGVHKKCSSWSRWTSEQRWNVTPQYHSNCWRFNTRKCPLCFCPLWSSTRHATLWANIWNFLTKNGVHMSFFFFIKCFNAIQNEAFLSNCHAFLTSFSVLWLMTTAGKQLLAFWTQAGIL